MSDERPEYLKLRGEVGNTLAAAKTMQAFLLPKEIYQIGETARAITERAGIFSRSERFPKIGSSVQAFASTIPRLNILAGSPIGEAMNAMSQMSAVFNTSKSIIAAVKAFDSIGITQRNIVASLNLSMNSELFELIQSGRISAAQIASGFEEAIAAVADVEDLSPVNDPVADFAASNEVINAFLSNGSLKGLSLEALRLFVFMMLAALWKDPIGYINKGFELQRNLSGLFTSVETPAEARAQARHLPPGADKSSGLSLVWMSI